MRSGQCVDVAGSKDELARDNQGPACGRRRQCRALHRDVRARDGARVLMLEAAPFEERGGNSPFTGGAFRFAYQRGRGPARGAARHRATRISSNVDFGTYTEEQYFDDMSAADRVSQRPGTVRDPDPQQPRDRALGAQAGRELQPGLGRQAYKVDGKFKFWGGLACHIWGGGPELLKALYASAERARHPGRCTRRRPSH